MASRSPVDMQELDSDTVSQSPAAKRTLEDDSQDVFYSSPFQLTRAPGLSTAHNRDTLNLPDLLGSPTLVECWNFNFRTDIHFLMLVTAIYPLHAAVARTVF